MTIRGRPPRERVLKLRNISAVTTAQGMPVRAWDLSVGARLNILNNAVSLRACDVPTGTVPCCELLFKLLVCALVLTRYACFSNFHRHLPQDHWSL